MVWTSMTEFCITLLQKAKFSTGILPAGHVFFQGDEKNIPLADLNPAGKPCSPGFSPAGYHITRDSMIPLEHFEFSEVTVTVKTDRVFSYDMIKRLLKKDKK